MKIILISILILFNSCFTSKKNVEIDQNFKTNPMEKLYEGYEDFDLFSFEPIGKLKKDLQNSSVNYMEKDNKLVFTLNFEDQSKEIIITKNKKGNWTYLQESPDLHTTHYSYFVFYKERITFFNLIKIGSEKRMRVTGFGFIYPINIDLSQKQISYLIDDNTFVNNIEEIDVNFYIDGVDRFEVSGEYFYQFDLLNKNSYLFRYRKNKTLTYLVNKSYIYNSKSVASPYYFFWKPYASEIIDN